MHQHHQQQLQLAQLLAHHARRAAVEGGAEIGNQGAWGSVDVIGSRPAFEIGSAGLFDVIGDAGQGGNLSAASALANPRLSRFQSLASFANPANQNATVNVEAIQQLAFAQGVQQGAQTKAMLEARELLQRPLGLPPNAVMTMDSPGVSRKQYIGLGPRVTIAAGLGADITAQPQSIARIERLIIESVGLATASGRDFVVSRCDIGDVRQLTGTGEIPGTAFSAEGFQLDVKLDTSNPGNTIVISIENLTAAPITIALVGIGTVVR